MRAYNAGSFNSGKLPVSTILKLSETFKQRNGEPIYVVLCAKRVMVKYWNTDTGVVGTISSASLYDTYEQAEEQANVILENKIAEFTEIVKLEDSKVKSSIAKEDWSIEPYHESQQNIPDRHDMYIQRQVDALKKRQEKERAKQAKEKNDSALINNAIGVLSQLLNEDLPD